jgi:hypothetical protein
MGGRESIKEKYYRRKSKTGRVRVREVSMTKDYMDE